MTTTEISKTFNIKRQTINKRLLSLGLNKSSKNYDYPTKVVELVSYNRKQVFIRNRYNDKLSIKVMELYFYNNNNEIPEIAKALNISEGVANRVINNYFNNNNFLIIQSKMND